MSVEELNKQQNSMSVVTGLIIGAFTVFTFIAFQYGFSIFTMIPVFFLPLVIINFNKLKKIKKELRLRG